MNKASLKIRHIKHNKRKPHVEIKKHRLRNICSGTRTTPCWKFLRIPPLPGPDTNPTINNHTPWKVTQSRLVSRKCAASKDTGRSIVGLSIFRCSFESFGRKSVDLSAAGKLAATFPASSIGRKILESLGWIVFLGYED